MIRAFFKWLFFGPTPPKPVEQPVVEQPVESLSYEEEFDGYNEIGAMG